MIILDGVGPNRRFLSVIYRQKGYAINLKTTYLVHSERYFMAKKRPSSDNIHFSQLREVNRIQPWSDLPGTSIKTNVNEMILSLYIGISLTFQYLNAIQLMTISHVKIKIWNSKEIFLHIIQWSPS